MRLDLADEAFDRVTGLWHIGAGESRLTGHIRRTEPQIKTKRNGRHDNDRRERRGATVPVLPDRRSGRQRHLGIRRGEEPPRDFDAGRLRFGVADQACRAVAVDFFELILIDQLVAAAARRARGTPKRPQHGENRRRGHNGKNDPKGHQFKTPCSNSSGCRGRGCGPRRGYITA